jgi:hypothetical protein
MAHRRIIVLLTVAGLAAGCAAPTLPPDAVAPTAAALAAEPPAPLADVPTSGEQLTYGIALAGLPVGTATLTTRTEGESTRLEIEGGTNPVVGFFYAVRGVARARLDAEGRSRFLYLWIDEDGKRSERALAYRELPFLTYRPWNAESWVASLTQYRAPRDPLSLLMEVRRLEPSTEPHDFEVAMTLRSFCYRARYLGRADVDVDAGRFEDALLWRVEVRPYLELGETTDVGAIVGFYDLALSADARRLPLRVSREFGFGQIALELERAGPLPLPPPDADAELARAEVSAAGR